MWHLLVAFKILTPDQIKHIQPVDPALLSFMIQHGDTTEIYIKRTHENSITKPWTKILLVPNTRLTRWSYNILPQSNNESTKNSSNWNYSNSSTHKIKKNPEKHSCRNSTGSYYTQPRRTETNWRNSHWISRHFARHRFGISTNRKFKVKHPTMSDQQTVKVCQHQ